MAAAEAEEEEEEEAAAAAAVEEEAAAAAEEEEAEEEAAAEEAAAEAAAHKPRFCPTYVAVRPVRSQYQCARWGLRSQSLLLWTGRRQVRGIRLSSLTAPRSA